MDPNETLRRIRELHKEALAAAEDRDTAVCLYDDAAVLFDALTEWLAKGGFAPDWRAES